MAVHVALSWPRGHGGEGQRLFLRPKARNRRVAVRTCGLEWPVAGADRQFRRWKILAGAGRRVGGAQASGLARGVECTECVAGRVSEQPAMVLLVVQAGHGSAEGAGGSLPRSLAVRSDRSRTRNTAVRMD